MCPCHEQLDGSDERPADAHEINSPTLLAIALDMQLSVEQRKTLAKVYRGLVVLEA